MKKTLSSSARLILNHCQLQSWLKTVPFIHISSAVPRSWLHNLNRARNLIFARRFLRTRRPFLTSLNYSIPLWHEWFQMRRFDVLHYLSTSNILSPPLNNKRQSLWNVCKHCSYFFFSNLTTLIRCFCKYTMLFSLHGICFLLLYWNRFIV